MYLFVDTHARDGYAVGVIKATSARLQRYAGRATGMLPKLARVLGTVEVSALDGIVVVAGPGSFSSVRTGVLDANLLARLLRLPLYGIHVTETTDLRALVGRLDAGEIPESSYVAPIYDAEPNITIPKSASVG